VTSELLPVFEDLVGHLLDQGDEQGLFGLEVAAIMAVVVPRYPCLAKQRAAESSNCLRRSSALIRAMVVSGSQGRMMG
jgi:hypothetical protein